MLSPRGQSGLEDKILASALASASASISLSYYVIGHFSDKNRVKFQNFVKFSGNNLKSYVVNHYLVLFSQLFLASASTSRNWPRPRSSGHGLKILASFNITALSEHSLNWTDYLGKEFLQISLGGCGRQSSQEQLGLLKTCVELQRHTTLTLMSYYLPLHNYIYTYGTL